MDIQRQVRGNITIPIGAVLYVLPVNQHSRARVTAITEGLGGPWPMDGGAITVGPFTDRAVVNLEAIEGDIGVEVTLATSGTDQAIQIAALQAQVATLFDNIGDIEGEIDTIEGELGTDIDAIPGLDVNAGDNSAAFEAAVGLGGTFITAGKTAAVVGKPGLYQTDRVDWNPRISLLGHSRNQTLIVAKPNMPALTEGPAGVGTGGGAPNSVVRILRQGSDTENTQGYHTLFEGITIDGNKGMQTSPIALVRLANPQPTKNLNDPDPTFVTKKDYKGVKMRGVELLNGSGAGLINESGNGNLFLFDVHVLGCAGNGVESTANDVVVSARTGFGSCGGFSFKNGQGSGLLIGGANFWGNAATRSLTCGALWIAGTDNYSVSNSVFNDWIRLDGNGDDFGIRGGIIAGNTFAPHDEYFSSDGVGIDVGNPLGSPDPRTQAFISIQKAHNVTIGDNAFSRTTNTTFATPSNVGGALDGSQGTAPANIIDAELCFINANLPVTTEPGFKQWTSTLPVPIVTRNHGNVTYYMRDAFTGGHRWGAKGQDVSSWAMLCCDESLGRASKTLVGVADPIPNYFAVEIGRMGKNNKLYGDTWLSQAPIFDDEAIDRRGGLTEGQVINIHQGRRVQYVFVGGSGVNGLTFAFPSDMAGTQELDIVIAGDKKVGTITTTGATWASKSRPFPNTFASGYLNVRLLRAGDTGEWSVLSVQASADPWLPVTATGDITLLPAFGNKFKFTLTGAGHNVLNPAAGTARDGQQIMLRITQGGGGTLVFGNSYKFPSATPPTLSTTVGAVDLMEFVWDDELGKALFKGFWADIR